MRTFILGVVSCLFVVALIQPVFAEDAKKPIEIQLSKEQLMKFDDADVIYIKPTNTQKNRIKNLGDVSDGKMRIEKAHVSDDGTVFVMPGDNANRDISVISIAPPERKY